MKGSRLVKTWVKNFPGRGTSMCKNPEAEMSLVCLRTRKMTIVPGTQWEAVVLEASGWP